MVLALWVEGLSPDEWCTCMREEFARLGADACRVHPEVASDGILDVHVDVESAAHARRLTDAVGRLCRERPAVTLTGAWILCDERVDAVSRGRRRPAREPAHQR